MAFDRSLFAGKLSRYCDQLGVSLDELSENTGIPLLRVNDLKEQKADPTGDEVLIIADFFKCDYNFFISNERLTAFEQTEKLFRKYGDELTKDDRWSIQEFLFLSECEQFLFEALRKPKREPFSFRPQGNYFKRHGQDAARSLRGYLNYPEMADPSSLNIFEDFARMGVHIFRRKVKGTISGLCIRHPVAGPCILINYSEDPFRQRFSAAHEIAHTIFDLEEKDFVISFSQWKKKDLTEIRANTFASNFLIPPGLLTSIPIQKWDENSVLEWARKLMVNVEPFVIALRENGLINKAEYDQFKVLKITRSIKGDPEIPDTLPPKSRERIAELLQRGLSRSYVDLSFDAYHEGIISAGRLSELLLIHEMEISDIAGLYGRMLEHGS
jgi:Zn-dependent peptidase ImmA (M78 family)